MVPVRKKSLKVESPILNNAHTHTHMQQQVVALCVLKTVFYAQYISGTKCTVMATRHAFPIKLQEFLHLEHRHTIKKIYL